MTIYYSSSDIAGVFYGKLIEIIINKDEKGVSIFLILHTPCGYFLRFVKKSVRKIESSCTSGKHIYLPGTEHRGILKQHTVNGVAFMLHML